MSAPAHNPCGACGLCCRSYIVPVCGYDVWRLSAGQRLSPEQFLVIYPPKDPGLDSFLLAADGEPQALALDKQGRFAAKRPCVFLLTLADGTSRCGVYAQRPVTCQIYPMAVWSQVVFQRQDVLCPPESWPLAEVLRPGWRAALQQFQMQFDLYHEVVARWNARVLARPGARFAIGEYFSYLLNVYDALARLADSTGVARLAEVQASWPTLPRPAVDQATVRMSDAAHPWLEYLGQARRVIDQFYPEIPPQPLLALLPLRWPAAVGGPRGKAPPSAPESRRPAGARSEP